MLQLGEEAENRLSTEKHKILRLLGIIFTYIVSFSIFFFLQSAEYLGAGQNMVKGTVLYSPLYFQSWGQLCFSSLPPPQRKERYYWQGHISFCPTHKSSWCSVLEKRRGKKPHKAHKLLSSFGLRYLKHQIWIFWKSRFCTFNCIGSNTQLGTIKKFLFQWF